MLDSFIRSEAAIGVPSEAASDEVEKGFIFAFKGCLEGFAAWAAAFALC